MVSTRKRASGTAIMKDGDCKGWKRIAAADVTHHARPVAAETVHLVTAEVDKSDLYTRIMQRSVACERPVAIMELTISTLPDILERRGWEKICTVKVPPAIGLVREFYSNITPDNNEGQGSLHSIVRGKEVEISPDVIARVLQISRKKSPKLTGKDNSHNPTLDEVSKELCNDRKAKWDKSKNVIEQAKMSANYRLINMVYNSNIHPRMHSTTVSADRAQILYAIGRDHYIDLPLYMFNVMHSAYSSTSRTDVLPFGSIISKILRKYGIRAEAGDEVGKIPGPINIGTWNKSNAHCRKKAQKNEIQRNEVASKQIPALSEAQGAGPSTSIAQDNTMFVPIFEAILKLGGRITSFEEFVRKEVTELKARVGVIEDELPIW